MKKQLILPIGAVAMTAAIMFGTSQILAYNGNQNHDALVQRIASSFGKSDSEVQAVFDSFRADQQAQRESEFEARIAQAVSDGSLTADQQQLLIQKHEELQTQHQADVANKDSMTREEWRAERQAERDSLESWASDNGIDITYLMPERGPMAGQGPGMGGEMGRGMGGQHFNQK